MDLPVARRLEEEFGDPRKVARGLKSVDAVEAEGARLGELAYELGMVQEDRLLHEGHDVPGRWSTTDVLLTHPSPIIVLELAREVLRLAASQFQR